MMLTRKHKLTYEQGGCGVSCGVRPHAIWNSTGPSQPAPLSPSRAL